MSKIQGKIKLIGNEEIFGNNFRKVEIVVITEEQYPQPILVEFVQDKCDLVKNLVAGQDVIVHYNLRGREWVNPQGVTKHFNSIQGWKVDAGAAPVAYKPQVNANSAPAQSAPELQPEDDHDDLPF